MASTLDSVLPASSETPAASAYFLTSATNVSSFLNPSPKDLLMLLPRMAARAGNFATITLPDFFEHAFGGAGEHAIAYATGDHVDRLAAAGAGHLQETMAAGAEGLAEAAAPRTGFGFAFSFQHIRIFGGIFAYMTSKWALGCFAVAIILNRTRIYASARRHLDLGWQLRAALRLIPIVLFYFETRSLLQALRCQTSPQYPSLRYGDPERQIEWDFAGDGGLWYRISSFLLFWQSEQESCLAVNMIPSGPGPDKVSGSLALLWPVFQALCISGFVETLSCAVQGRPVMTETGMSIFEHSLAFAEAETMATSQFSFAPPGGSKSGMPAWNETTSEPAVLVSRSLLLARLNTPPEVLLMALISSLNNLSSHVLGVLGMQGRFRLINTGVWGLCFMGSFLWGFLTFSIDQGVDAGILRFPTVCVVGFIPHILILLGILVCGCIYTLALFLSILSPPPDMPRLTSWRERFWWAQGNMQANIQLSTIRFNMHEDFYTALVRIGFSALSAASEAVFLNEGRRISVGQWTWLEDERMKEVERSRESDRLAKGLSRHCETSGSDHVADGNTVTEDRNSNSSLRTPRWKSGYTRERGTKSLQGGGSTRMTADGVGALQRGGRYLLAWGYLTNIFWLCSGWVAVSILKILNKAGIGSRPEWLAKALGTPKVSTPGDRAAKVEQPSMLHFWILSDEGELILPTDGDVDVEVETKKRLQLATQKWGDEEERQLDSNLYGWFTHGGWWGDRDSSGDYELPVGADDDATSVISMSTATSEVGWESDGDGAGDGRRTPTQQEPFPFSRESTPGFDQPLDPQQLARLLDPRDPQERADARILAHHLASNGIVTRSQFRKTNAVSGSRLLTSTRYRPQGFQASSADGKLAPHEEAEILEYLIIKSRSQQSGNLSTPSWRDGADGLGVGGPQCVVCQSSPRTILAWPCRCLSLCEECRVSLAMNNFATCVCCRQEVVGFSRLFVP
jgi:hypothetical protein